MVAAKTKIVKKIVNFIFEFSKSFFVVSGLVK